MATAAPGAQMPHAGSSLPWYRQLSGYHWLVLCVGTAAWAFDCFNQQIFNLARKPAMESLVGGPPGTVDLLGALSTSALLVGWATGGILFGIMGDRVGRVRTLVVMIVCYSAATGLCGLSLGPWDYLVYCFITGMGAGGIFPVGCTLVAESLPDRARPHALGMVQTISTLGNVGAGLASLGMVALLAHGVIHNHWRWMFSLGFLPALLAIVAAARLREPEAWRRAVAAGQTQKAGLRQLFAERRWRRNAIVGLMLAVSGVVGLWGIGVFSNDLTQAFVGNEFDARQVEQGEAVRDLQFVDLVLASSSNLAMAEQSGIQPRQLLASDHGDNAQRLYASALARTGCIEPVARVAASGPQPSLQEHIDRILSRQKARQTTVLQWAAITLAVFNLGAFCGVYAFTRVTQKLGRRPTFAIFFLLAMVTTALAFWQMKRMPQDLWMVALMGGAQLSVFGGYAIYFPELFPTRLRSTGCSFCYNVGRYLAAAGPLAKGFLTSHVFASSDPVQPARSAGVAMCSCFLIGLVALLFAPETKGQPLPE